MNEPDAYGTCSCPCGCMNGGGSGNGYCADCAAGQHR
jgi:hypothetical protein